MSIEEKTYEELVAIKKILLLSNSDKIDLYLSNLLVTENRRKMWILIDGINMAKDIAEKTPVSLMAVSDFLKLVKDAGLIKYEIGKPPKKIFDYVPSNWLEKPKEDKE